MHSYQWDLNAPSDIAQSIMECALAGIEDADYSIDDIHPFSKYWSHHTELLATIFHCLCENGFTIHTLMCEWLPQELTGSVNGLFIEILNLGRRKTR